MVEFLQDKDEIYLKIKMLKRISFGLRNVELHRRKKCYWASCHLNHVFTQFDNEPLFS